jgi:cell division protein FtsB
LRDKELEVEIAAPHRKLEAIKKESDELIRQSRVLKAQTDLLIEQCNETNADETRNEQKD